VAADRADGVVNGAVIAAGDGAPRGQVALVICLRRHSARASREKFTPTSSDFGYARVIMALRLPVPQPSSRMRRGARVEGRYRNNIPSISQ
jgi:hypothetical protein